MQDFKQNHPILFYLFFPITFALIIAIYLFKGKPSQSTQEAIKKDDQQKQEIDKIQKEAQQHIEKAEQLELEIQKTETSVDENWHLKKK